MELEQLQAELQTAKRPRILAIAVRVVVKLITEFITLKQRVSTLEDKVEKLSEK